MPQETTVRLAESCALGTLFPVAVMVTGCKPGETRSERGQVMIAGRQEKFTMPV